MSWGTEASYLAVQGGLMFATRDTAVYKINMVSGENTLFLTLASPKGLAIFRKYLFVVNADTIVRVNLRTDRMRVVATGLLSPTAIAVEGNTLYVIQEGTTITQLNLQTRQRTQWVTGLTNATDLTVNATDMYVTCNSPALVAKISLSDKTVTNIPFSSQSQLKGVALHNNFVYVANYGVGAIAQIRTDDIDRKWQLLDKVEYRNRTSTPRPSFHGLNSP